MLVSLLGSVAVSQQGRISDYLLAGVGAGLSTATKYTGILVLSALLLGHGLHARRAGRDFRRSVVAAPLLGALVLAGAVFLVPNPYLVVDWRGNGRGSCRDRGCMY